MRGGTELFGDAYGEGTWEMEEPHACGDGGGGGWPQP